MSSEPDRIENNYGWVSESESDNNDDDTNFIPSDSSKSISDNDVNGDLGFAEMDADVETPGTLTSVNISLNEEDRVNELNNEEEMTAIVNIMNTLQDDQQRMNDELNDYDTMDMDNQENIVSLSDKYKSLNQIGKTKMKSDEKAKWLMFQGKLKVITFLGNSQYSLHLPQNARPIDYFKTYLNNDILQPMVDERNRNAAQVLSKVRLNRRSKLRKWKPTTIEEMNQFLGILLYMGLVPMPRITDYWSKNILYRNLVAHRIMSRNKFQLLLRFWHLINNNANIEQEGGFAKILPLLTHLNSVFRNEKSPGQDLVVDESMIPFRGRLIFKQYLPNKTHKYRIKIFKICDNSGYTYKMKVYMGKGTGADDGFYLPTSVVMDLP